MRAHWAAQVSVCVHDEAAVIWAGEETPCALGVVSSLGSINQANNAALTAAISELIEPFGVNADRMYLNVCPPRPPPSQKPFFNRKPYSQIFGSNYVIR